MSFLKLKELKNVKNENLNENILSLTKELVELRLKKATRQKFKPHMFTHKKRQLSQLLTLENLKKLTKE
jgi:large subunit ribosomal protein L29